jgi:benzodiazapine receptor
MRHALVFAAFLVLVLGGGLAIGSVTRPDAWYAALTKPSFNPPNWVFAPVWSVLYVLVAVTGARIWLHSLGRGFVLWVTQLVLNFVWSPVFFGLHLPRLAVAIIAALLLVNVVFIVERWPADRIGALLFVPYVAWVTFATLLNASIVVLN